jgi:hypothetical protein
MDDLSVEVGHPNGAYYKVSKISIMYKTKIISPRDMCMIWMKMVSMLNMIKSKSLKIFKLTKNINFIV